MKHISTLNLYKGVPLIFSTIGAIIISSTFASYNVDDNPKTDDFQPFITSLIGSIFVAAPLTVDVMLDSTFQYLGSSKLFRWAPTLILIVPNIILLNSSSFKNALIYQYVQQLFNLCYLLTSLGNLEYLDPNVSWSTSKVSFIALASTSYTVLLSFVDLGSKDKDSATFILSTFFAIIMLLVSVFSIAKQVIRSRFRGIAEQEAHIELSASACARYLEVIFYCTLFVQLIAPLVLKACFGFDPYGEKPMLEITCYHYFLISSAILMTIWPGRISSIEASETKRALSSSKTLVRQVSHEIRNPMNVCFIGLEMLFDDMKTRQMEHSVLTAVDEIRESCQLSLNILNEMLTYDKLVSGKLELEKRTIRVSRLVYSACNHFIMPALSKNLDFVVSGGSLLKNCFFHVDNNKISQVIRNFVSNAIKFTPESGKVSVHIEKQPDFTGRDRSGDASETSKTWVSRSFWRRFQMSSNQIEHDVVLSPPLDPSKNFVIRIEVRDSGVGVDSADQKKLFNEYVQINAGVLQNGGGSGLGLSIAKSIVRMHGGQVGMISEGLGKGSVFFLELPAFLESESVSNRSVSSSDRESVCSQQFRRSVEAKRERLALSKSYIAMPSSSVNDDGDMTGLLSSPFKSKETAKNNADESIAGGASIEGTSTSVLPQPEVDKDNMSTISVPVSTVPLRVLIIDDAPTNRKMLGRLLLREGIQYDEAEDGYDAVEMIGFSLSSAEGAVTYDAVFMDYSMPKLDGPDAAKQMRDIGYRNDIIGVSGNVMPSEIQNFINNGASRVLAKPINTTIFRDIIKGLRQQSTEILVPQHFDATREDVRCSSLITDNA